MGSTWRLVRLAFTNSGAGEGVVVVVNTGVKEASLSLVFALDLVLSFM